METTQTFETIIRINLQEAKNNLEQLRKKVDDLKAARDKAIQSKADITHLKPNKIHSSEKRNPSKLL